MNDLIQYIREWLEYDPSTGLFCWAKTRTLGGPQVKGRPVGTISFARCRPTNVYVVIRLRNRLYNAHRIAWMHAHGPIPEGTEIDHINGDGRDNRLCNLRAIPHQHNAQNRVRAQRNNQSSGLLGVSWDRSRNKWQAGLTINGRRKALGRFDTKEDAYAAVLAAKRTHHAGNTL